jgi:S-adenosylmethionine hydrolase
MRHSGPVITLTTDFGYQDSYAAELKLVLMRLAPAAAVVDITHAIPAQNVAAGSFILKRVIDSFEGPGIHVAVVDPGVGSSRRALLVRVKEQFVICPDNGLITWIARRHPLTFAPHEILWRPVQMSATFHGRDLFAPIAAMLANGEFAFGTHCRSIADPVLLPMDFARAPLTRGQIIYIDHYGNAVTNVTQALIRERPPARIIVGALDLGPVRETYSDVAESRPLALIGSNGLVEIAVRNGSAARQMMINVGDVVQFE